MLECQEDNVQSFAEIIEWIRYGVNVCSIY